MRASTPRRWRRWRPRWTWSPPAEGQPLHPGWQWLFFNPIVRQSSTGADGHPRRTPESFLPPISLPRRMSAGSRIRYLASLAVGAEAVRTSRIRQLAPKEGKSGRMYFVTVAHRITSGGRECIAEEQGIVYREASPSALARAAVSLAPSDAVLNPLRAARQRPVSPDAVLLFRYSALTFNAHRPYARDVEGYPGLVVQGPLTATLLQGFAVSLQPQQRLAGFEFRGLQPLFASQPFTLCADEAGVGVLALRAVAPDGRTAVEASATFATRD
jgi:3-methylfumaryl-CoA hydratase